MGQVTTDFIELPDGGWVVKQDNTRSPFDTRTSKDIYSSEQDAKTAYKNRWVRWERWHWEKRA